MDEPKDRSGEAPPSKPAESPARSEREARLASALRANLRRRKAAERPSSR